MAKIQNTDNTKCWQVCGATQALTHCWWECKMVQPLWKTIWRFLTKLNVLLPYNPAIVLLGIYPNELKTYVLTKTCTWIYSSFIDSCQNSYRHFGRQFGSFLPNRTYSYHMIQQSHSLVFTQRSWKITSTQKPAHRFIADLFIIAKTRKPPTCPSVGDG